MTTRKCLRSPFESRDASEPPPETHRSSRQPQCGKMCCHFEKQHQVGGDPTSHEIKADLRTSNRFETRSICEPLTGCPIAYFDRAGKHSRRDGARLWTQVQLRKFLRQGRQRERHYEALDQGFGPRRFPEFSIGKP
jgi:hypothetical protein